MVRAAASFSLSKAVDVGGREKAEFGNINGILHTVEIEAHADYILSPLGGTELEEDDKEVDRSRM
jgi:hypothetical protein